MDQTPRLRPPPIPKAAAALAQADTLIQAGQPLPRALWADLSLRAPEKDLERLLLTTLKNRIDLEKTVIPCQDDDAHLAQALTRLVHVAQALHLNDPFQFYLQDGRLFLTYLSRRPEAPFAAARALLNEFDSVLRHSAHPVTRLSALRNLLGRIDPDDTFDFQALCDQVLRVLGSTYAYRIEKQGRGDVLNDLLRLVRPFDTANEDIWAATARRLKEKDDNIARALEQKHSRELAAITDAPEPSAHPDLTPGFVGALTQVELLTLTGQTLTRAAWAELSLHAPEYELRRLLRNALEDDVRLGELFTLPDEEKHLHEAFSRLIQVTYELHLTEPERFFNENSRLFTAYHSCRPEPPSEAARALLTEFNVILYRTRRIQREYAVLNLLNRIERGDDFDFRTFCAMIVRLLLSQNHGSPVRKSHRRQAVEKLLWTQLPPNSSSEDIWTTAALKLGMNASDVRQTLDLWRTGELSVFREDL